MSNVEEDEFELGESEGEEDVKQEEDVEGEEDAVLEQGDENVPCSITQEMISQGLSMLCKTGNGLAHAFVRLDLKEMQLTDIALLRNFVHLRFVDLSSNRLSDLSVLAALTQLLWLKVDRNLMQSFVGQPVNQLAHLQWLSMESNRIHSTEGLGGPALESINLIGNNIQRLSGLDFNRLTSLVTLDLRGNQLESTDGIYLPNLCKLYLAQNRIKRLEGLDKLERLTTLHLRDNQLETLDGLTPNMKALQYLNVRGNLVSSQRALRSLAAVAGSLRVLLLAENPLTDSEDYRLHVLNRLPLLKRLDKEDITADEKEEAKERLREHEEDSNDEDN